MRRMKWLISLIVLFIGVAAGGYYASRCDLFSFQNSEVPTWKSIIPGKSTQKDVVELYGNPDSIIQDRNLFNLKYERRPDFRPRDSVEFIITNRNGVDTVVAIFGDHLYWGIPPSPYLPPEDLVNLEQVVSIYGKPSMVTWSSHLRQRYLMWPQKGIAVIADPLYGETYDWDELEVMGIIIFEPMSTWKFIYEANHWGKVSSFIFPSFRLPTQIPDRIDLYPEDPYDWEHMPLPIP